MAPSSLGTARATSTQKAPSRPGSRTDPQGRDRGAGRAGTRAREKSERMESFEWGYVMRARAIIARAPRGAAFALPRPESGAPTLGTFVSSVGACGRSVAGEKGQYQRLGHVNQKDGDERREVETGHRAHPPLGGERGRGKNPPVLRRHRREIGAD